jgi:hypothetical protein
MIDDEHGLAEDELNDFDWDNFDWARWHYEGKRFEVKAVSRGEFAALKRFGDYEELRDRTLMRMEGEEQTPQPTHPVDVTGNL